MTVSIEGFVLQNLLMNALILILAARLAGVRAGKLRIGLASALGCGYAVCAYLPWGRLLLGLLPRTAACAGRLPAPNPGVLFSVIAFFAPLSASPGALPAFIAFVR